MTKNPHIEKLNFNGTVEEWNNSTEISGWIKATKIVICTDGAVEK